MVYLAPSLLFELHGLMAGAALRGAVYESHTSRYGRHVIDILPCSGYWRITDTLTGEYTEGEANHEHRTSN